MSAVERMTAQLMKMIFGNSDIGSIKGRNADDDQNATTMQELCNWQIEYANAGYQKFYWWVKECLYQLYSVVMVTQKREYEEVEEDQQVPYSAAEEFMNQCIANKVDIVEVEEMPLQGPMAEPVYNVKIKYTKLTANYPLIENVPSEELIWIPAKTLGESELVGRRKQVTIDYLVRNIKKKQADGTFTGMYDKKAVMQLVENGTSDTESDQLDEARGSNVNDAESYDINDPNRKVTIVECFVKADINNDHKLEDCIITVVEDGNIFIRYEENEDGFPFCIVSPVFDPYKVVPDISGIDALGQWQDLLTAIIRLTVQNLALNNNPQQLCNSAAFVDFNQVLDGDAFIEINGLPSEAMAPTAQIPLAGYTLDLIELVKGWGEEASNVNRYNQGIDANSLNKTATGMQLLVNQGSQAMELIMRNIAETGLKSLFMRMIYLNQKYVDHDQIVRLTNKDITVNKENLSGNFDYIVNAGMGAGAKETDIQNIMQVNQVMPTLIQAGLATLKNAYNAQKKWLELIGIRNIDDYLQDPDQNQQPPQQQDEKKISESIQAKITDAPWQIQMQHWAKLGYQVTPEMFIQKQQMELDIKRQEAESKANADMNKTITQAKIQDHHADKLHQHSMEAANLNNSARERQMTLNAEITRNNQQGAARAGGQEVPGRDIQGSPAGYSRQGVL